MKLIFLGCGSAFTTGYGNYHSNMLLTSPTGKNLIIDCGSDARFSLFEQGYSYKDISDVYISHLHGDHAGGLEWLGFTTKFDPKCTKPTLHISESLVHDLWSSVLAGGMSSIQGGVADLETYYNLDKVKRNQSFHWEGVDFKLIQTIHIMDGFSMVPSFGLLFKINEIKVFITTDTQYSSHQLNEFYKMADIIFHDCETAQFKSGVHAHFSDLITLPDEIKAKMWLYHYNPGELPNAKGAGFLGFVAKGQHFDFDDIKAFPPKK